MRKIVVSVCTYNRPDGLRALLASIDRQRFERISDGEIGLVVIDNSQGGTASAVCATYAKHGRFRATFVHEPRKGLSVARNAALTAARTTGATHIAFIDDDELPDPGWLEALLDAVEETGAAAAIGPVDPLLEALPEAPLPLAAFADRRTPHGGFVDDGYTCNALVLMSAIDAANLKFDMRFNETGGEDTYFFKELRDHGMKIAWSERALVHAVIPRHRLSAGWILRRWYRTGMIEAHLGGYDPATIKGRLVNIARGSARLLAGTGLVAAAAVTSPWRERGAFLASFYTGCRGAGLIANAFNRDYHEYAEVRYR